MKNRLLFIFAGVLILYANTLNAQVTLPYYTGFDSPSQLAGWNQYILGVNATYGPWGISSGGFSAPDCIYHDYNNTGLVEDWYVSPAMSLAFASRISIKIRTFAVTGLPASCLYGDGDFSEQATRGGRLCQR